MVYFPYLLKRELLYNYITYIFKCQQSLLVIVFAVLIVARNRRFCVVYVVKFLSNNSLLRMAKKMQRIRLGGSGETVTVYFFAVGRLRKVRLLLPLAGAAAKRAFASASVMVAGLVSLGILAFFLPSVM
jgi:hypothetical protein